MTKAPMIKVDAAGIGKALDWAWKIGLIVIPSLYGAFSFYSNQGVMEKREAQLESRMTTAETEQSKQARDNVEKFAKLGAGIEILQTELDFYTGVKKKAK
jgi:hypothetical protein